MRSMRRGAHGTLALPAVRDGYKPRLDKSLRPSRPLPTAALASPGRGAAWRGARTIAGARVPGHAKLPRPVKPQLVWLEGDERQIAIEAHWREWHQRRDPARHAAFVRASMSGPWGRRAWRVAGLRDKHAQVLATAYVYELHYRLGSQRLVLGGIGALCVRPDLRRLGLGRMLLEALHVWMHANEYAGAALYSRVGRRWYASMGYEELPARHFVGELPASIASALEPTSSVVRAFRESDFGGVRNLYNTAAALQPFALLREDAYWRHRLERIAALEREFEGVEPRALFLVGEREGEVASYLRCVAGSMPRTLVVLEYGFQPGASGDVAWLLDRAANSLPERPAHVRALAPARVEGLVPWATARWLDDKRNRFMIKSFGSFEVPHRLPFDDRLVWASDVF